MYQSHTAISRDIPETDRLSVRDYFSKAYAHGQKHDSPEKSRISIARRIKRALRRVRTKRILNIGSGPQSIERQMICSANNADRGFLEQFHFITLDNARIPPHRLLGHKLRCVSHIQATACSLPFHDATFGLVFSNLAIDFAPQKAFRELGRVAVEGAPIVLNLHHPRLVPLDLHRGNELQKIFWRRFIEDELIFGDENQIERILQMYRIRVDEIILNCEDAVRSSRNMWWEVEGIKI